MLEIQGVVEGRPEALSILGSDLSRDRRLVAMRVGGRRVGLHRVRRVREAGMHANPGGICFSAATGPDRVRDASHTGKS